MREPDLNEPSLLTAISRGALDPRMKFFSLGQSMRSVVSHAPTSMRPEESFEIGPCVYGQLSSNVLGGRGCH